MKRHQLVFFALLTFLVGCGKKTSLPLQRSEFSPPEILNQEDNGQTIKLQRQKGISSSRGFAAYATPRYGYGQFFDWFLAFSDYLHGTDQNVLSVVRLSFGQLVSALEANQPYNSYWRVKIESSNPLKIQRYKYSQPTMGVGIPESLPILMEGALTSTERKRDVIIFTIMSKLQAQPACAQPLSQADPNSYYYYYPPPSCAQIRANDPIKLHITASAYPNFESANSAQSFDLTLDDMINTRGYAPYRQSMSGSHELRIRAVNYNGNDWYY